MSEWDCEAIAEGMAASNKHAPGLSLGREWLRTFLERATCEAEAQGIAGDDRTAWIVGWLLGQTSLPQDRREALADAATGVRGGQRIVKRKGKVKP